MGRCSIVGTCCNDRHRHRQDYQNASYQALREDDIQKQAEAILLAEKMKKAEEN